MRKVVMSAAVLAMACASVAIADPVSVKGKVDAVTVYRGQAMVSRVVELPKQPGPVELVITDLPQKVVPGSLFAEGPAGVQVRSVLYRTRAVAQDVREEVRKIDEMLKKLMFDAQGIERQIEVIRKNSEYLNKMEQFVATTAQAELSRGVLNADTLEKLTTTVFTRRSDLAKQQLEAEVKLADTRQQIELVQRQRAEVTRGAADTAREAVVLLDAKEAGKSIKLNYLVEAATWSPSYTINASDGNPAVTVLYQAAISQMSGEEWGDVQMTLSTATPSVVSRAPKLEPLSLSLRRDVPNQQAQQQSDAAYVDQLKQKRGDVLRKLNSNNHDKDGKTTYNFNDNMSADFAIAADINAGNVREMNGVAQEMQMAEFRLKDKLAAKMLGRNDETITVTYQLPGRSTLQSRSDQQLVGISTVQMKSSFYKLAVPVLTPYVYDEAQVTNDGKTVLLAGPSVSYMNGQFVGQGDVPTTFVGGTFTAGFGIDPSLRAGRELVERVETTQGGNNIIAFDYRLSIENFGGKPAQVRLLERIPKTDGNQIKPTLVSSTVEVSKDAEFERTQRKQGLLRFDLEVPAGAVNGSAKSVDYKLTIEHDKQMEIAGG